MSRVFCAQLLSEKRRKGIMIKVLRIVQYCLLMKCLHIYCDGAARERFKEKVRNPLRMGYAGSMAWDVPNLSQGTSCPAAFEHNHEIPERGEPHRGKTWLGVEILQTGEC